MRYAGAQTEKMGWRGASDENSIQCSVHRCDIEMAPALSVSSYQLSELFRLQSFGVSGLFALWHRWGVQGSISLVRVVVCVCVLRHICADETFRY